MHERRRIYPNRIGMLVTMLMLLGVGSDASAQGGMAPLGGDSRPAVGGTRGLPPPPQPRFFGADQNLGVKVHLNAMGKPCVIVYGYPRAHAMNANIFDHVIFASNSCGQLIKMQVCYLKTQHCVLMEISGYQHKEALLGMFPGMKDFRFEYREQFEQRRPLGGPY